MYFFLTLSYQLYPHGFGGNAALPPGETCCSSASGYHALPLGQIYRVSAEGKSGTAG